MSKSTLKQNMSTNQVENAVSLEKSRWFNKPAQKKQVQEMVYVDTHPMIVTTKKEKLSSDDKKTLKLVKKDFKESKKNVKIFKQLQNDLCKNIVTSITPNWGSASFRIAL